MSAFEHDRQISEPLPAQTSQYNPDRYRGLSDAEIARQLHNVRGRLLLRGRLVTLLARREIGGLLQKFARHHPRQREEFEVFAKETVDLDYTQARRLMQLWVYWPRCLATLERLEARQRGVPYKVPGLRKLLAMAGVIGKRPVPLPPEDVPSDESEQWISAALPDDVATLRRIIEGLRRDNRVLREQVVLLRNEIRQMPKMPLDHGIAA